MPLAKSQEDPVDASVIVPSYNSSRTICRCLDALLRQDCQEAYEILVADSSDDGTAELIARRYPQVRLIRFPEKAFPGKARNRGVREARGAILAFTDADCVPRADWLRRHLQRQKERDLVAGALSNANPWSYVSWGIYICEFSGLTPTPRQRNARGIATANVSYKRAIFDEATFPEDMFPGEDAAFHRLIAGRHPLWFDGQIVAGHINRSTLRGFLGHMGRQGRAAVASWRRVKAPGDILLRHPFLAFATPFYRMALIAGRVLRDTPRYVAPAVLASPLVFLGLIAWACGFYAEARRGT